MSTDAGEAIISGRDAWLNRVAQVRTRGRDAILEHARLNEYSLLFAFEGIVIPEYMRPDMAHVHHEPYIGMAKSSPRPRTGIFLPGMSIAIENMMSKVALQKVAFPLMSFKCLDYLVVVDYYSRHPDLGPSAT